MTSLRDAIGAALGAGGGVSVTFAPNVGGQTLQLQGALPNIDKNITINNTTGKGIAVVGSGINAQDAYRVFVISPGTTCEIDNLTISGGYADAGDGGGVYNSGTLKLVGDTVTNNTTDYAGGGIFNGGTLNLISTAVNNNVASLNGGGIYNQGGVLNISGSSSELYNNRGNEGGAVYNDSGGKLNITGATIGYNTVPGQGGGIYNRGQKMVITGVTFYENYAGSGGGIYTAGGTLTTLKNCYLFSNVAKTRDGGGMSMFGGQVTISGGTIQGNTAKNGNGGGIYVFTGTLSLIGGVIIGSGKKAIDGGGLYADAGSTVSFGGCTVAGNSATGLGAGVAYDHAADLIGVALGLTDKDDPNGPVKVN